MTSQWQQDFAQRKPLLTDLLQLMQRDNQDDGRIASPEMFPNVDPLPHLKCSRPGWGRGGRDEAGEHGGAG